MGNLHPTLWRTCRTLANPRRLACLKAVFANPGSPVEAIAEIAHIPHDQASLCLRALQARGLICAERQSRWVRYSPVPDNSVPSAAPILTALQRAFFHDRLTATAITETLTAFTHPRRLTILSHLRLNAMQPADQLSRLTQISPPALWRHLRKLKRRSLVSQTDDGWQLSATPSPLAQTLLTITLCGQA